MAEEEVEKQEERKPKKVKTERQGPNALVRYFRETRGELRKVTWPTREDTWRLTLIVLGVSAAMAVFLGLILDTLFSRIILGIVELTLGV